MRNRQQELEDMAASPGPAPENPFLGMAWEELLARVQGTQAASKEAIARIRAANETIKDEITPWRMVINDLAETERLLREALKLQALENYRVHRRDIGKRFAGVTIQFRPKILIHDLPQAVMALDGLYLINHQTGEAVPLITYQPVINEKALRTYIEIAAEAKLVAEADGAVMPAPDGWPGIVTLQTDDDDTAWTIAISAPGKTPADTGEVP